MRGQFPMLTKGGKRKRTETSVESLLNQTDWVESGNWCPRSMEITHNYNLRCHFCNINTLWNRAFQKKNPSPNIFAQLDNSCSWIPCLQAPTALLCSFLESSTLEGGLKGKKIHRTSMESTKLGCRTPTICWKCTDASPRNTSAIRLRACLCKSDLELTATLIFIRL